MAPGATVTFAYRATRGARVRIDLLQAGKAPTRIRLGIIASRGTVKADWTAALPAGKYTARLVVSGAGVTRYLRAPLTVVTPPPVPPRRPRRPR